MLFSLKICDLIKNYVHHGEKDPRREVGDHNNFVNIFVKKHSVY